MKILMTGGSGLLGAELLKIDKSIVAPSAVDMDIRNFEAVEKALRYHKPQIVIHLAAATNPPEHEKKPELGIDHNIIGTAHVAHACFRLGIRLIYTSSDYVYAGEGPHKESDPLMPPSNFYWSKLGGECAVVLLPNSLILRLSFGPSPYPWERVYENQFTSKLYVQEIAPLLLATAQSDAVGVLNIGGPRISLEDYARRTRPEIQTIPRPAWVPQDVSLDISRMKEILSITDEKSLLTL